MSQRLSSEKLPQMSRFYAQVIASLVQRGAILFEVGVLKRKS